MAKTINYVRGDIKMESSIVAGGKRAKERVT